MKTAGHNNYMDEMLRNLTPLEWDVYWMHIVLEEAEKSTCTYPAAAALVSNNKLLLCKHNQLWKGCINYTPSGRTDTLKAYRKWERYNEYQADYHLINEACTSNGILSHKQLTLYTTRFPCIENAKLITAVGISRVVTTEQYNADKITLDTQNWFNFNNVVYTWLRDV